MVTVRNPVNRLSDELYKAMQAVLDALFNANDSEYEAGFPPPTRKTCADGDGDNAEAIRACPPRSTTCYPGASMQTTTG